VKWLLISPRPDSIAVRPSGCDIETVSRSSSFALPGPNACSAAICSISAWFETLTAGSAILSPSPKSLIDFTFGLRVFR
jgi:hypothetical protein